MISLPHTPNNRGGLSSPRSAGLGDASTGLPLRNGSEITSLATLRRSIDDQLRGEASLRFIFIYYHPVQIPVQTYSVIEMLISTFGQGRFRLTIAGVIEKNMVAPAVYGVAHYYSKHACLINPSPVKAQIRPLQRNAAVASVQKYGD